MYATGMQGLEIKIKPNNLCNIIFEKKIIGLMLNQRIFVLVEIIRISFNIFITLIIKRFRKYHLAG